MFRKLLGTTMCAIILAGGVMAMAEGDKLTTYQKAVQTARTIIESGDDNTGIDAILDRLCAEGTTPQKIYALTVVERNLYEGYIATMRKIRERRDDLLDAENTPVSLCEKIFEGVQRDEKGHIMHPDGDMIAYIFATLSAQRNGNSKPAEALKTRIKEDLMRSRIDPSQYE